MDNLERVIEGCRCGDEAMQRELYRMYSPRFYALCRRYTSDDELAREALVEGFLEVFNSVNNFRSEGSFEGWMQTIFIRKAVRVFGRERRRQNVEVGIEEREFVFTPRDIGTQIDIREALVAALRSLSEKERKVFNLVAIEQYTLVETAEILSLPESTVKTQYYRAQRIMKKKLTKKLGKNYIN